MIEEILQPKSISLKMPFYGLENKEIVYKLNFSINIFVAKRMMKLPIIRKYSKMDMDKGWWWDKVWLSGLRHWFGSKLCA